jgi:hypothetical protein
VVGRPCSFHGFMSLVVYRFRLIMPFRRSCRGLLPPTFRSSAFGQPLLQLFGANQCLGWLSFLPHAPWYLDSIVDLVFCRSTPLAVSAIVDFVLSFEQSVRSVSVFVAHGFAAIVAAHRCRFVCFCFGRRASHPLLRSNLPNRHSDRTHSFGFFLVICFSGSFRTCSSHLFVGILIDPCPHNTCLPLIVGGHLGHLSHSACPWWMSDSMSRPSIAGTPAMGFIPFRTTPAIVASWWFFLPPLLSLW